MAVRFACGVDLASWKKNKSYTISDFANYYDETNGYYWTGPDNFSCSDAISLASLNEAQTIEKIRSYVKNHIPVAVMQLAPVVVSTGSLHMN